MVMRLPLPNVENDDFIDKVVAERKEGGNAKYFNEIKDGWKKRIQDYLDNKGNPEVIKVWNRISKGDEKKFINLYKSPQDGSVQKPIIQSLRSRTLQICPACGEDGTPNTLDHYLPKDLFPEFAITAANLSPMCDICQGIKLTQTVNGANERIFLHPYYDEFMDTQVVLLEFDKPLETPPSFKLRPSPNLDTVQAALISRHLNGVGVIWRYNHFFRDEYMRLLKLTYQIRQSGQDVRAQLENFRKMASYKSVNSWQHVFYSGVISDASLMDYLETGKLPDFV